MRITGPGCPKPTPDSTLNEQESFDLSGLSITVPCFPIPFTTPCCNQVGGIDVEDAIRWIKHHIWCFGASIPILVKWVKYFTPLVLAIREQVEESSIGFVPRVGPQQSTRLDQLTDRSEADEVIAPESPDLW